LNTAKGMQTFGNQNVSLAMDCYLFQLAQSSPSLMAGATSSNTMEFSGGSSSLLAH